MEKRERMRQLVDELNKHIHNYYVLNSPTISDFEYDRLYDELLVLEKEENFIFDDSPTIRVNGEVQEGFKKVEHVKQLQSLDKINNYESLSSWLSEIKSGYPSATFSVEYKFDGLTICCEYNNGKFVSASTRGNGFVGEDVTNQVLTIKSLPLKIDYKGHLYIRGEGMMKLSDLKKYNEKYDDELKNARNAVSGAIRNLDPKETAKRNLHIYFYDIVSIEDNIISSQSQAMEFLQNNGFLTYGNQYLQKAEDVVNLVKEYGEKRSSLDILTDGAVIKVNEFSLHDELGMTSKFPKWAIAYKFPPEEVSSLLKDVVWQVGRTGKITPIAIVDKVNLAGATIERATLNNYGDILRKKVKIGARVFIRRSNEVIPEILSIAEDLPNSREILKPQVCPCCQSKLVEDGANIFCRNVECPEIVKGKLIHFASKDGVDIVGLSDKIIDAFYKKLNVRTYADLYYLTKEQLLSLDSFKEKKSQAILNAIEKSKNVKLNNLISALNILNIGKVTAKELANEFGSLENLMSASYEHLASMYDIGDVMARGIFDYFKDENNLKEINRLLEVLNIEKKESEVILGSYFENKKCVLTGSLESMTRSQASEEIEKRKGKCLSSVSSSCDLVIAGESAGSKLDKAKKLNIEIINEKQFIELLNKN